MANTFLKDYVHSILKPEDLIRVGRMAFEACHFEELLPFPCDEATGHRAAALYVEALKDIACISHLRDREAAELVLSQGPFQVIVDKGDPGRSRVVIRPTKVIYVCSQCKGVSKAISPAVPFPGSHFLPLPEGWVRVPGPEAFHFHCPDCQLKEEQKVDFSPLQPDLTSQPVSTEPWTITYRCPAGDASCEGRQPSTEGSLEDVDGSQRCRHCHQPARRPEETTIYNVLGVPKNLLP